MAETRFEGTSPVARYWLTRCEGFAVRGGPTGVVESLIREADPHETAWLVVRTRGRRRQTVPVQAVALVDPAERVVVVERPEREPRLRPAVRAATAAGGTAARAVAPRARTGAQSARSAAAATAQAVGPVARSGGQHARSAVRFAAPYVEQARGSVVGASRAVVAALAASLRRLNLAAVPRAAQAAGRLVGVTLVQSFRSLAAEARYPKPYVPANRSASSRTSSDAGKPTTFR